MLVQVCCRPPPILIIPANNPRRPRALRRGKKVVQGGEADWLPDGHAVVFRGHDGVVRRLRANRIRRVGRGDDPQWSRKGRIAMVRSDGSDDFGEVHGIYTMSPTGRRVRRVASGTGPDWSPRGQWLVYAAPNGSIDMARGTEIRRIFSPRPGVTSAGNPAFSPDGRWVVFSGDDGLYVIRIDGSGLRKVGSAAGDDPTWQPLPRRRR
jgi:Tol biopolymer transport system component